jgi:hypothetical protein
MTDNTMTTRNNGKRLTVVLIHNTLHMKDTISEAKHPQINCKEIAVISWFIRNIYITSIISSRNYSPSRAPDFVIVETTGKD